MHALAEAQDTLLRKLSRLVGVGSGDHVLLSHRSACGRCKAPQHEPTAMQAVAEGHDTPVSKMANRPAQARWIDQRKPFQRSTNGELLHAGRQMVETPTAVQALAVMHDTPNRELGPR